MRRIPKLRGLLGLIAVVSLAAAACGNDSDDTSTAGASDDTTETPAEATEAAPADDEAAMDDESSTDGEAPVASAEVCDADGLVAAVEGGPAEGTLGGMTDDPVGTAASNNPVLTTLVTAVQEAQLVDTLNSAEALTVFAPTDCAFAALDPATLDAALADPSGLLTAVLGFHVIPGERLSADDLATRTDAESFSGSTLSIAANGDEITVGDQANIVVPDIQTANATVHLVDAVMLPPES